VCVHFLEVRPLEVGQHEDVEQFGPCGIGEGIEMLLYASAFYSSSVGSVARSNAISARRMARSIESSPSNWTEHRLSPPLEM
jgi:hypothetical protein